MAADDESKIEELVAELAGLRGSLPAGFQLAPVTFEKDDDTNFHMDLITALANNRARNYAIPEVRALAPAQKRCSMLEVTCERLARTGRDNGAHLLVSVKPAWERLERAWPQRNPCVLSIQTTVRHTCTQARRRAAAPPMCRMHGSCHVEAPHRKRRVPTSVQEWRVDPCHRRGECTCRCRSVAWCSVNGSRCCNNKEGAPAGGEVPSQADRGPHHSGDCDGDGARHGPRLPRALQSHPGALSLASADRGVRDVHVCGCSLLCCKLCAGMVLLARLFLRAPLFCCSRQTQRWQRHASVSLQQRGLITDLHCQGVSLHSNDEGCRTRCSRTTGARLSTWRCPSSHPPSRCR